MVEASELLQDKVFEEKKRWLYYFVSPDNNLKIACYGAAAKGNVFLNYLGIKNDIIDFCVDETPAKVGMFLPGSNIPIVDMEHLKREKPDIILILPWNFKDEIIKKLEFTKEWGAQLIWRI